MATKAMMAKGKVVPLSPGIAAAARCKPYLGKLQTSFLAACKKVGAEYGELKDNEKRVFARELNLSTRTLLRYAHVAAKCEEKLKVIQATGVQVPAIAENVVVWEEIVATKNTTLRKAARAGLFTEHEVSAKSIVRFRKTGALPALKRKDAGRPVSALALVRHRLQNLEITLRKAGMQAFRLRELMEKEGVHNLRGPDIELLKKEVDVVLGELLEIHPPLLSNVRRALREKG